MQTGLIALELTSALNRVPMDTRGLMRQFNVGQQELSKEELLRILKHQGFKSKIKRASFEKLNRYPMPAIAVLKNGEYRTLVNMNQKEKTVFYFCPEKKQAAIATFAEFSEWISGEFIIARHRKLESDARFGFQWFYLEILKYKSIIGEVLLGSFVVQIFGLITPLFTQVILDKVVVHHSMTTLDVLGVAFLAIMIFELLLNISRNYIFNHTANKIDAKLGSKLFKHLFSLPFNYFESRKVGVIVARVRELDNIREFITNKSVSVIIDTLFSVVFLGMMLLYSVPLSLMALSFILVLGILYAFVTPEFRNRLQSKFEMGAKSNSYLVETITGVQTVKALAIEGAMHQKWEDNLGTYLRASFRLTSMTNISQALASCLQRGMTVCILYFGVKMVIDQQLTIGQLIAFQMFANQFSGPVLRLVNLWNEFQQALLGVERLSDILNQPAEVQSSHAITLAQLEGAIRLDRVSFKYGINTPNVLEQLSFNIAPGTSVGLVGRSGSGKSTITKLIQRLYLPQDGAIYIDDVDIRHMNPSWLRHQIGVVLQENYLFSGTIRENIALPKGDASMDQVMQAARIAGAHEFIKELPEGYDTQVGERGSTLSGGQKQRIAIARALITNPRILIFDEATSALDYESERIIQENLSKIKQGRTMVIIAHRLSAVRDCDCIIAFDRGKIVEMGNHQNLMQQQGYYHALVTQQEKMNAAPVV
jgi:subfamily B ATP-binding cassette protein HlyB/CyaB